MGGTISDLESWLKARWAPKRSILFGGGWDFRNELIEELVERVSLNFNIILFYKADGALRSDFRMPDNSYFSIGPTSVLRGNGKSKYIESISSVRDMFSDVAERYGDCLIIFDDDSFAVEDYDFLINIPDDGYRVLLCSGSSFGELFAVGAFDRNGWDSADVIEFDLDQFAFPSVEAGPCPQILDGEIKLESDRRRFDRKEWSRQFKFHEMLVNSVRDIFDRFAGLSNEYPILTRAIEAYSSVLNSSLEDLDVEELWYRGNLLAALEEKYGNYDGAGMSAPLEPDVAAELSALLINHGAFVRGFEEGRELDQRGAQVTEVPSAQEVEASTNILSTFASLKDRVEERLADLYGAMAETLAELPLRASVAYLNVVADARALIHNTLVATGRFLSTTCANPVGAAVAAGTVLEVAKMPSDPALALAADLSVTLRALEPVIMTFAAQYPELRRWLAHLFTKLKQGTPDAEGASPRV